jgi:RecA-family ATPase
MSPTEVRLRLRRAGFDPIPCRGKDPGMKKGWDWTKLDGANNQQIEMWGKVYTDAHNTGILTRFVPAFDVDILHPEAAEAVKAMTVERFEAVSVRIGLAPKFAVLFQTDTPFPKINRPLIAPWETDEKKRNQKLEFLGDGQQLVAFGIHPDTHQPYRWHGGEPGEIKKCDLPCITEAEAQQHIDDATRLLISEFGYKETGWKSGGNGGDRHPGDDPRADVELIARALGAIPNTADWDGWNSTGMAIWRATGGGGAGFALFDRWSQKSPKYDAANTAKKWAQYFRSPPSSIGAGTIFHLANQHDPIWNLPEPPTEPNPPPWPEPPPEPDPEPKPQPQPKPAKASKLANAEALKTMTFSPIKYVVPNIIVEGLTLFAGKPKIGKSWMLMHAAVAVARGGFTLGEIHCTEGDVLYCALEDNQRRIQSRLTKLLGIGQDWPGRLDFCCEMPRLAEGGLDLIKNWIKSKPHPRLIIIDTLAMVRAPRKRDQTDYDADYSAALELRKLAAEAGVAIVLVHHLRKADSEDAFDTVSGTLGLTGAPDSVLILKRDTSGTIVLHGRGRDLTEIELAMEFDRDGCTWRIVGEAADVRRSTERGTVLTAINEAGEPVGPSDIARATGMKAVNVRYLLKKLLQEGEIEKATTYGKYRSKSGATQTLADAMRGASDAEYRGAVGKGWRR